jgi:hypothetical protein
MPREPSGLISSVKGITRASLKEYVIQFYQCRFVTIAACQGVRRTAFALILSYSHIAHLPFSKRGFRDPDINITFLTSGLTSPSDVY